MKHLARITAPKEPIKQRPALADVVTPGSKNKGKNP